MANWVKCTRKSDNETIYLNLDAVEALRWSETGGFTVVSFPGGKDKVARVLEHPDELFQSEERKSATSRRKQIAVATT
jgi:hypothetical protein